MASESLFWAMALVGASAKADEFLDSANEGQELGREQASGFQMPEALGDGKYLFPDQGMTLNESDLYPGSAATSLETLQGVYGSDEDMRKAGTDAQARLAEEASETGEAYRVLTGSASISRPDLSNDPIWGQTDLTVESIDIITAGFSDCTKQSEISESSLVAHVPEYKYCDRVHDASGVCEISHDYNGSVIRYVEGENTISSCGDGCLIAWLGKVGNNYWSGQCQIYEMYTSFQVLRPDAINSVVIEEAKWDDYMQILAGQKGKETLLWSGPNGNFPPETPGACELSTSWSSALGIDITHYFKNVQPEAIVNFKTRVSVTGGGEGYARIRINYDPNKLRIKDEWKPDDCLEKAFAIMDGFASGTITCIDNPDDGTGCVTVDGRKICESMLAPSPLTDIPPLCRKVSVDAHYDFYKGQMECWTDIYGNTHCPVNNGGQIDQCAELENDPQCGFISSECVDGAKGSHGTCFVQTETWDCGYDISVPTLESNVKYECGGTVRCMGEECVDPSSSTSDDFARAAAILQAANFMAMDGSCESVIDACRVFSGQAMECKKAVGGIVDCCQKPEGGPSLAEYIKLIQVTDKLMTSTALEGSAVSGAWTALRTPIANAPEAAWQTVQGNFSSAWDTLTGAATDAAGSGIKQELMQQTAKWVSDSFGQQAADALFTVNEQGLVQLGGSVGSILSTVMTAYMIYSIALILIQLIWQCEQKEFELGAKRELKSCHYVGTYCASKVLGICIEERRSYCCFNSPLSRIIQEQVRPQLGMGWGSAKNPQCDGITPEQMNAVNWEQVNLDEWLGILQSTGNWPGEDLNPEALTGQGNLLATPDRLDVTERTIQRLEDSQITEYRKEAEEELRSNIRTDSLMP